MSTVAACTRYIWRLFASTQPHTSYRRSRYEGCRSLLSVGKGLVKEAGSLLVDVERAMLASVVNGATLNGRAAPCFVAQYQSLGAEVAWSG